MVWPDTAFSVTWTLFFLGGEKYHWGVTMELLLVFTQHVVDMLDNNVSTSK